MGKIKKTTFSNLFWHASTVEAQAVEPSEFEENYHWKKFLHKTDKRQQNFQLFIITSNFLKGDL